MVVLASNTIDRVWPDVGVISAVRLQLAAARKVLANACAIDTVFAVRACPIIRTLTCELVGKNATVQAARHIA